MLIAAFHLTILIRKKNSPTPKLEERHHLVTYLNCG